MLFARTARFSFRTIGSTLLLGSGFAFAADPVPASPSPAVAPSTPAPAAAVSGTSDSKPASPAAPVTPAAGTTPAPAAKSAAAPAAVVVRDESFLTQEEQAIVDLTNNERARYGLPAFTPTPALMRIAREQSQLMATYRTMSHAVGGRHLTHRLQQAGYPTYAVAENCAQGQWSPQAAVQTWMASAGHRTNMLNGGYRDIGVAMVWGSDGRPYYTQVFSVAVGTPVVTQVVKTTTTTTTPVGTKTVNPAPAPVAPAPTVVPASATSPAQAGSGVVPASGTAPAK